MKVLFFIASFLTSVIGSICGIGGGVIMKPVLDLTGILSVSAVSFLSGCTVLAMSVVSVMKHSAAKQQEKLINVKIGTPLGIGAAFGGVLGKEMFTLALSHFPDAQLVGALQAILLMVITLGTLFYTLKKDKIKTLHMTKFLSIFIIGIILGVMSSFLGIGGGPINIVILGFCFSMGVKQATANSLYVIMFSQLASLGNTIIWGDLPEYQVLILIFMIAGGIIGAHIGGVMNKKIQTYHVERLFVGVMGVIILINAYNIIRFLG